MLLSKYLKDLNIKKTNFPFKEDKYLVKHIRRVSHFNISSLFNKKTLKSTIWQLPVTSLLPKNELSKWFP